MGHADSRVQAQTPFTSYTTNIHKPTRPGSIYDGLRAASNTLVRPAPARAAHAGLLQCATESNNYVFTEPTATHATSTTSFHHPPLPRTRIPAAATTAGNPHGPQLSPVLRQSAEHASTVQHHARPSSSHGYRRRLRAAAELRLPDGSDLDGWITADRRHRGQE